MCIPGSGLDFDLEKKKENKVSPYLIFRALPFGGGPSLSENSALLKRYGAGGHCSAGDNPKVKLIRLIGSPAPIISVVHL